MRDELPPPLPPETRTVGQLVAESIRFYQDNFWQVLPLGFVFGVLDQLTIGHSPNVQVLLVAASAPLMTAAFLRASALVAGGRWSWPGFAAGTLVFVPVGMLVTIFILPAAAWLAFIGLAVPAAAVERLGVRDALRRGRELGTADYVHALGSICTLAIVFILTKYVLVLLLQGQADVTVRTALMLGDLVLSPLVFVGSALLYLDQRARLDSGDASLHPPLDAVDAGRPDAEGEPRPAPGSQP